MTAQTMYLTIINYLNKAIVDYSAAIEYGETCKRNIYKLRFFNRSKRYFDYLHLNRMINGVCHYLPCWTSNQIKFIISWHVSMVAGAERIYYCTCPSQIYRQNYNAPDLIENIQTSLITRRDYLIELRDILLKVPEEDREVFNTSAGTIGYFNQLTKMYINRKLTSH